MRGPTTAWRTIFPGGLASIDALRSIAELSLARGNGKLRLTSDQQIAMDLPIHEEAISPPGTDGCLTDESIGYLSMSTAGVVDIHKGHEWLSLGAFQEILDLLPLTQHIRVGVVDRDQPYLPWQCGDLLYVASDVPWYWQIAICERGGTPTFLPWAIPSSSTRALTDALDIEAGLRGGLIAEKVSSIVAHEFEQDVIPVESEVSSCAPEPELLIGLQANSTGAVRSLNVFPEWGEFSAQFLLELCLLAKAEHVGMVALTPYRSLLISNLPCENLIRWKRLIGRFRISMVPPEIASRCLVGASGEAQSVSKAILEELIEGRYQASGLSISFLTDATQGEASIRIIPTDSRQRVMHALRPQYDLVMRKSTYSETGIRIASKQSVPQLIEKIKQHLTAYNIEGVAGLRAQAPAFDAIPEPVITCGLCGSHYDETYGDPLGQIDPGILFGDLPDTWTCPVCESSKAIYVLQ